MIKKRIIFTAGTFDLLHYGHLNILLKAKELGDYLIVGVSSDKLIKKCKGELPIVNYKYRAKLVRALSCVDKVVEQKKLVDIKQFKSLKADIFVIGDDWRDNTSCPGIEWLRKNKKIVFIPYTKSLSTTKIKIKIIQSSYNILKSIIKREK